LDIVYFLKHFSILFNNFPLTKYAKYTALHEFSPMVSPLHLQKLIST